jgi:hypothetical protein
MRGTVQLYDKVNVYKAYVPSPLLMNFFLDTNPKLLNRILCCEILNALCFKRIPIIQTESNSTENYKAT